MKKAILIIGLLILGMVYLNSPPDGACLHSEQGLEVCAGSEMIKVTRSGQSKLETAAFDLNNQGLQLQGARNATIAFQLFLKRSKSQTTKTVAIDLEDPGSESGKNFSAEKHIRLFAAHYHWVELGGYRWGSKSEVLPWPDHYPDALVPQWMQCGNQRTKVFDQFTLPENLEENQAVWVDIYIPKDLPADQYKTEIQITSENDQISIPVSIDVKQVVLPDKPTIQAVAELYDAYLVEGAGIDLTTKAWAEMAQCYQQLAHRHRMIFWERKSYISGDSHRGWEGYDQAYDSTLTGELFSEKNGYTGPGMNTPVTHWRTPWSQKYNVKLDEPLSEKVIEQYTALAKSWQTHADQMQWSDTEFSAYLFDEVDGATDEAAQARVGDDYIVMVHDQMQRVQKALDQGAGGKKIDLIWTSHSDAAQWQNKPGQDLAGIIRHWVPNAHATNTAYFTKRKQQGERVWFYHSGHPAIGIHSINARGIEMRTWGVAAAKYRLDGNFMWALNYGDKQEPYRYPSYRKKDDRFGNGMMVYPGNKLENTGYPASPGPVPSIRLKVWRQGLQDAELIQLARKAGHAEQVEQLIQQIIPTALSEGNGKASWSTQSKDWLKFHHKLLELASENK